MSLHPRGEEPLQTRAWSVVWLIFLEMRTVRSRGKLPPVCSWDIENSTENRVCVKNLSTLVISADTFLVALMKGGVLVCV